MRLEYSSTEALEILQVYYPNNYKEIIAKKKQLLVDLAKRHQLNIEKAYRKFIMPLADKEETISFFVALSEILKIEQMNPETKKSKILELEEKRQKVSEQIFALENNQNQISYEDKKILRGYYTRLQQETTQEINELLDSFQVVEPQLIIHQPGLFDQFNR